MKVMSVGGQNISVSHFNKSNYQHLKFQNVADDSDVFIKDETKLTASNPSFKKINKNKLLDGIAGGVVGTVFGIVGYSLLGPLGALILGGIGAKGGYETNGAHVEDYNSDDESKNDKND